MGTDGNDETSAHWIVRVGSHIEAMMALNARADADLASQLVVLTQDSRFTELLIHAAVPIANE